MFNGAPTLTTHVGHLLHPHNTEKQTSHGYNACLRNWSRYMCECMNLFIHTHTNYDLWQLHFLLEIRIRSKTVSFIVHLSHIFALMEISKKASCIHVNGKCLTTIGCSCNKYFVGQGSCPEGSGLDSSRLVCQTCGMLDEQSMVWPTLKSRFTHLRC